VPVPLRRHVRAAADVALRPISSVTGGHDELHRVALTVDDGPDDRWTPELLELLEDKEAHATFFLLAYRVRRHPQIVRDLVSAGHEVALHGWDHTRLTTLPTGEVRRRTRAARAVVEDAAQRPVRWFRPPFGAQSLSTYAAIRSLGLDVAVWNATAEDWVDGSPGEVAERALGVSRAGSVLLMHDGLEVPAGSVMPSFDRTATFRALIDGLATRGLRAVGLSELVAGRGASRTAWFRP
jgi:peptidoglycan/xylan/chitin deacetylase (PgdA/CDA1 family)